MVDPAGSTALALLPFLGRGYSRQEGPYKQAVERGLPHLVAAVKANKGRVYDAATEHHGGSVQALTAMVLSEAYGMSQDPELVEPAQLALNFMRETQVSGAGGWRYSPGEAGCSPVTSFMIMALKSGHMAKLQIGPATIPKGFCISRLDGQRQRLAVWLLGKHACRDARTARGALSDGSRLGQRAGGHQASP